MLLPTVIACALLVALPAHYLFIAQRKLILGPETVFVALSVGTFVATQVAAVRAGELSHPYANYIGLGLLLFLGGTAASRVLLGFEHRRELRDFAARHWIDNLRGLQLVTFVGVATLTLAVTVAYNYVLGSFVPQQALQAFLTGGESDMVQTYSELRRSTYATGDYLAPGYVQQFSNTLLPLMTIILFVLARIRRTPAARALFGVFLVTTILAAIGAGRRYPIAFFAGAFIIIGLAEYLEPIRLSRARAALAGLAALLLLTGMTLLMGSRGIEKVIDQPVIWAPLQVLDRVVTSPAKERFLVYELFLARAEPQWGRGHLRQLKVLLPGKSDFTLSNELHELLYGSPTGNVGLDLWGSLWYDFGWYGLVFLAGLGFLCNWWYVYLLRGAKRISRVVTLAFAGLILGLMTNLAGLVQNGFLTCLIFLLLLRSARFLEGGFSLAPVSKAISARP